MCVIKHSSNSDLNICGRPIQHSSTLFMTPPTKPGGRQNQVGGSESTPIEPNRTQSIPIDASASQGPGTRIRINRPRPAHPHPQAQGRGSTGTGPRIRINRPRPAHPPSTPAPPSNHPQPNPPGRGILMKNTVKIEEKGGRSRWRQIENPGGDKSKIPVATNRKSQWRQID